jgi:iron complex outermembrane receptor protein
LQWTAGLFYMSNRDTYVTFLDNNRETTGRMRLGGSSTTTKTYAAFLDATYELTSGLFLTAGARYAHDTVDDAYYNIVGTNGAKQFVPDLNADRMTPRVVLRYKPGERSSVYASYTRGYKAGILDVGGGTSNRVKPETLDSFEVGYKYDARRFSFDGSAFYYDYKNLQVSLFKGTTAQLVNAASSRIYGLEGQIRYRLDDHFQFNAGATWTHARYRLFVDAPVYMRCPQAAGCGGGTSFFIQPATLRDVSMQRTPEFTGNAGARYQTGLAGGEIALSGNYYYSSKLFFGPSGIQFPQKGYDILSLRAEWTDRSDSYTLAVWGDNVTDTRYLTTVQYGTFGIGANWNRPVTYGVEIGAKF